MTSKPQTSTYLVAVKLLSIAASMSACSVGSTVSDGIVISASPQGMQAFSDMLAGTAQNAKASPDAPTTPYYDLRREQNRASVLRFNQPRQEGK